MRLKNWIRMGLVYAGILLCGVVFMALYMGFLMEAKDLSECVMYGASYALLFSGVLTAAFSIGIYRSEVPLALSFGATRREVFVGLQWMRVFPLIAAMGASYALAVLGGEAFSARWHSFFLMGCGWLLFINAAGMLFGLFATNKGKAIVAVGGGVIGLTAGVMAGLGAAATEWEVPFSVAVTVLAVGAAAMLAVLPFEHQKIHTMVVRL